MVIVEQPAEAKAQDLRAAINARPAFDKFERSFRARSLDEWMRPDDVFDEARTRSALAQLWRGIQALHIAGTFDGAARQKHGKGTPNGSTPARRASNS